MCIYKYICIHASWNSKTFEGRIPMDLFTVNSYQNHSSDGKNHVNIKARWLLQAILIFYLGEMIPKFHFKTFFFKQQVAKNRKKTQPRIFSFGEQWFPKRWNSYGGVICVTDSGGSSEVKPNQVTCRGAESGWVFLQCKGWWLLQVVSFFGLWCWP